MTVVLKTEDLTIELAKRRALEDIGLTVRKGESIAVCGGSACGKSVLFHAITGLERPTAGRVFILGEDIYRLRGLQLARLLSRVGIVHQGGALLHSLTVLENVKLPLLEGRGVPESVATATALETIEKLKLGPLAGLMPRQLSRGEVVRVTLARAVSVAPELLICDDIFSGLDLGTLQDILALISEIRRETGKTMIIFTPSPDLAVSFGERILVLDDGQAVATGTPDEILRLDHPAIRRMGFGAAGVGHGIPPLPGPTVPVVEPGAGS